MKKLLVFALLFCSPLHAVVILVHGTYAVDESWARPGGKFYEELRGQAGERKLSLLVPFAWSGQLSGEARVQAAEALCDLIESYPWDEETIVGLLFRTGRRGVVFLAIRGRFGHVREHNGHHTEVAVDLTHGGRVCITRDGVVNARRSRRHILGICPDMLLRLRHGHLLADQSWQIA